jgi:predicted branched-subunit amino acid permease
MGIPMPMTYYGIGLVFGAFAIITKFSPRHWIYYVLITPTAALLNAFTTSQAAEFGKQRVIDNVVGVGLVIIAALFTLIASRYMDKHTPTVIPTDAPVASPA